jgi:CHAT domain-containing protein
MVNFYTSLASHPDREKAGALQTAALRVMKDGRYRHPFYWSGFVLVWEQPMRFMKLD